MSINSGESGSFLPTTEVFESDTLQDLNRQLTSVINDHALVINQKDTGIYNTDSSGAPVDFTNGQTWFPNPSPSSGLREGIRRNVLRKVVNFGALPNATTKSVAHNITTTNTFSFTRIYGCATDPGASTITTAIPIPFASPTLNQNISLTVDATNVNITTGIDRTAFTVCYVVLEWIVN